MRNSEMQCKKGKWQKRKISEIEETEREREKKKKHRRKKMDSFGCEESTTRLFASPLRPASPRLAPRPCVGNERR
jgi:hypothetical protein